MTCGPARNQAKIPKTPDNRRPPTPQVTSVPFGKKHTVVPPPLAKSRASDLDATRCTAHSRHCAATAQATALNTRGMCLLC